MASASIRPATRQLSGELLASVSRSFYLSIKVLPRKLREPIALAYLFARASDTIADSGRAKASTRLDALGAFREMIVTGKALSLPVEISSANISERRLLTELPRCVEWLQSMDAADRRDIEEVLEKITRGQELDVRRFGETQGAQFLETAADLDEYTYLVAGCVGEFWTRVCFRHVPFYARLEANEMTRIGRSFGQGLQLVNILRDLPADLREGRCYLPREEAGESDPVRLRQSFADWLMKADAHLGDGFAYIESVRPWRLRYACFLPWKIGVLTLDRMRKTPPLDTSERVKVPRTVVRATMLSGLVAAFSNRVLRGHSCSRG